MSHPLLYILSGLPGVGKTTLARLLARDLHAVHLRIDTIEQALRDARLPADGPEGYLIAYRLAADNLRLGLPVVADSVNPLAITRAAWRTVAAEASVPYVDIEITCSNPAEHRARVESRATNVPRLRLPTWDDVRTRAYDAWDSPRLMIDTAGQTESQSLRQLKLALTASR